MVVVPGYIGTFVKNSHTTMLMEMLLRTISSHSPVLFCSPSIYLDVSEVGEKHAAAKLQEYP